ncbi:MAG: InlB B-repeat-containing protein [bacterium]|nr:InlB B-repeat-containing protein [bacterium]
MKRKYFIIYLLLCLIAIPNCVIAVGKEVDVTYNIPANISFNNKDIIINEKVNVGEKILEPSHIEISGYEFLGWFLDDKKWNFDEDVVREHMTLKAKYAYVDGYIKDVTDPAQNYMNASALFNSDDIPLTLDDVNYIDLGYRIEILLKVEKLESIDKQDEKMILELLNKNKLVLGSVFDVELLKTIDKKDSNMEPIYETSSDISVNLIIPESIRKLKTKYAVIRIHDGKCELVYTGLPDKNWNITFKTNKFSTYAIAYFEDINNPKTYDGIFTYTILLGASFTCIISIVLFYRKKRH